MVFTFIQFLIPHNLEETMSITTFKVVKIVFMCEGFLMFLVRLTEIRFYRIAYQNIKHFFRGLKGDKAERLNSINAITTSSSLISMQI